MKIRKLLAIALLLLISTAASAQVDENCLNNSSISHESVKARNYKDAYGPWKEVIKDCPLLRYYTFTDGFEILTAFVKDSKKGSDEYNQYFNELMDLHDKRMEFLPKFVENGVKGVPSVESALGSKAMDYLTYAPNLDVDVVYGWMKTVLEAEKVNANPALFYYFVDLSLKKLQKDNTHKEVFINDYLLANGLAEEAFAASDEANKPAYEAIKDNVTAVFINSGAADCTSLQEIYAPKVEENKDNKDYLKQVIAIMERMRCRDQEAYAQASFYLYQIEPSADAAVGCGYRAYKKGDLNEAIRFFDEAIELEQDQTKKAEKYFASASILYSAKRYSQARSYALKALGANPNYGDAYILIARLYATSPNWSDEPVLNKCTYFLVLDKLQRAKSVDPSVASEANELIRLYSPHTPSAQDLFMLGYKKGDSITIGGWIGESTTIR